MSRITKIEEDLGTFMFYFEDGFMIKWNKNTNVQDTDSDRHYAVGIDDRKTLIRAILLKLLQN